MLKFHIAIRNYSNLLLYWNFDACQSYYLYQIHKIHQFSPEIRLLSILFSIDSKYAVWHCQFSFNIAYCTLSFLLLRRRRRRRLRHHFSTNFYEQWKFCTHSNMKFFASQQKHCSLQKKGKKFNRLYTYSIHYVLVSIGVNSPMFAGDALHILCHCHRSSCLFGNTLPFCIYKCRYCFIYPFQ